LPDFTPDSLNELLVNPKLPGQEKTALIELQKSFENLFGTKNYFLVPSSGSARQSFESVKLIALKKTRVLNSARRFNSFFDAGAGDNWGMVLPDFHVAGLGVIARAHLSGAKIYRAEWPVADLNGWITQNQISYLSLVPAQVYDIVRSQVRAPERIKMIFVGAGALNPLLLEQAQRLEWPIAETFGMTETASMVAVKRDGLFELFPGVEAEVLTDILRLRCNSLLSASVQKINDIVELKSFEDDEWFETTDCAELVQANKFRFLGRKTDYVKILGEGVSLSELRDVLEKSVLMAGQKPSAYELMALEDERAGYRLVLAAEIGAGYADVLNQYNKSCRAFEKIGEVCELAQLPRTPLGKLKRDELERILIESLTKGSYGES
jgi:O-succinylbenzoic acid--CoA ligase